MRLGVAGPSCGVTGHGPREPARWGTQLRPASSPALLCCHLVEVREGGGGFGVQDGVHVLGPADDAELGHRLPRADHQLHARAQAGHQALPTPGMVGAAGTEQRPPVGHVHFSFEAEQGRPRATPGHRRLAPGGVIVEGVVHRVVAPAGHGVLVVGDRVSPHHPHPRHVAPPAHSRYHPHLPTASCKRVKGPSVVIQIKLKDWK